MLPQYGGEHKDYVKKRKVVKPSTGGQMGGEETGGALAKKAANVDFTPKVKVDTAYTGPARNLKVESY